MPLIKDALAAAAKSRTVLTADNLFQSVGNSSLLDGSCIKPSKGFDHFEQACTLGELIRVDAFGL